MEKVLFRANWHIILIGSVYQYIHSVATNLVYYLHVPHEPLRDLGFELLSPPLEGSDQFWSEILIIILVVICIGYAAMPCFRKVRPGEQRFVTLMIARYFLVLVFCQTIRMISFLVTILPSPNSHCREDSPDYNPPTDVAEIFTRVDASTGCGDLIPSSHAIFATLGGLLMNHYSKNKYLKAVMAMLVIAIGFLVVAARKHYSIDVVAAWYICPLAWFYCSHTFPDRIPNDISEAIKEDEEDDDDDASSDTVLGHQANESAEEVFTALPFTQRMVSFDSESRKSTHDGCV
jgi:membrane-associated phospholipid phosphatase